LSSALELSSCASHLGRVRSGLGVGVGVGVGVRVGVGVELRLAPSLRLVRVGLRGRCDMLGKGGGPQLLPVTYGHSPQLAAQR
jgi:hypothetical protein